MEVLLYPQCTLETGENGSQEEQCHRTEATDSGLPDKLNMEFFINLKLDGKRSVVDWCMKAGLIAKSYECPQCTMAMRLGERDEVSDGFTWICRESQGPNKHFVRRSIRKGSWFEESELSMIDTLILTYLWVKRATVNFIADEMNLDKSIVIEWRKFCRKICMSVCRKENVKLGGPGKIVEVDEKEFAEINDTGKRKRGNWVLGGVERGSNNCIFEIVKSRNENALFSVIEKYILPGTKIISSCWKDYECLVEKRFLDLAEERNVIFKNPETRADTNTVLGMWSALKREICLQGPRQCADEFDSYFSEYLWRKRFNDCGQSLLESFLDTVIARYNPCVRDVDCSQYRLTYENIC